MEQRDGSQCVPGVGSDVADVRPRRLLCHFQQVPPASCSHSCHAEPWRDEPMDWALPEVVLGCFLDCAELFFEKVTCDFN